MTDEEDALDELVQITEQLGLYDRDPTELQHAAEQTRHNHQDQPEDKEQAQALLAALDAANGPRPPHPQLHPGVRRERATCELLQDQPEDKES